MDFDEASMHDILECMLRDASVEPTNLPLSLLKAITNNFSDDQQIGSGGFSVVYKGLLSNGTVAVKNLSQTLDLDEKRFKQEVDSLMRVKHKNIVRFLGYCADTQGKICNYEGKNIMAEERQRLLCFEFLPKGSLDQYITDASQGLEWRIRYQIIKGICEGLHYLHTKSILHLDLKPANILLNSNMEPKIADFGLSRCFDEKQSRAITSKLFGSQGYVAPEFFSKVITFKLDIYSLGVIILEILTGQRGYVAVENVLESWKSRLRASRRDIQLEQVRVCAKIGIECIDSNPEKRPVTRCIIETLREMDHTYGLNEAELCTSSAKHQEKKGSTADLQQGTPKVPGKPFKDGLIKDSYRAASDVGSPSMANPQSDPVTPQSQGTKYNLKLYMHQIIHGPKHNQVNIADPQQPGMFGYTNVHDYPIYDGLGPSANIVAQAQGLHTETSMNYNNWFHWSSIVFKDERFSGSSFIAIGNLTHEGEWAIVGGTGVFTFAHGTIAISRIQHIGSSNIKEIRISALCFISHTAPTQTKPFNDWLMMNNVDSNVSSPSMPNPQSGPVTPQSQEQDYNLKLYMHQTIDGPNQNQVNIADPMQPQMFGYTNVHDYPIYDSLYPGAKIVAQAQGLHAETSMNNNDWFHWSSIVFTDERFRRSSFIAIGNLTEEGKWAIVGGTGVFTFAQGTISICRIQCNGSSNIKEIQIHALRCAPHTTLTVSKPFKDGLIKDNSNRTSHVRNPSLANPQNGRVTQESQESEYNLKLYMHQIIDGPNSNQVNIADPKQPQMFGYTNVHDYPIYDSLGPNATIVARAQGLHAETSMNYNDWFHWSSIVFTNERFRGSSLIAIGNLTDKGEWAIVGGTGMFTFAQGDISICRIQHNGSSNVKEIQIGAVCRSMPRVILQSTETN
ncbi:unnamed protein product [Urochloa decumbens]|uniref:Protein kinase domain-containing protein n=1 Tax=Urochloa decumbens TaxID=240449 RepID=A0ABC9B621_9POAL